MEQTVVVLAVEAQTMDLLSLVLQVLQDKDLLEVMLDQLLVLLEVMVVVVVQVVLEPLLRELLVVMAALVQLLLSQVHL
jgi:hypothetical protein